MLHEQLKTQIKQAVKQVYDVDVVDVLIEHPENDEFGDLSTNIAFLLAKQLKQSPSEIAKKLAYELQQGAVYGEGSVDYGSKFSKVEALQPGFINFYFSEEWLITVLTSINKEVSNYESTSFWQNKKIMVEYTDPNPFKVFHIGHLMTNAIGESLARIFDFAGAEVHRANYQGDVGMHVAKSIWGLINNMQDESLSIDDLENMPLALRIAYLGKSYARGATAYKEGDSTVIEEIKALNGFVYATAQEINETEYGIEPVLDYAELIDMNNLPADSKLIEDLYKRGRKWSLDYFETLYKRLGSKFDHYYLESFVAETGYSFVKENIANGIFEEDKGAVIYRGEKDGLHTRVFINSVGLPVYEAKDLGLAFIKYRDFKYDKSIIVTANEIDSYFKVVLKAMSKINPELADKTMHLGHGMFNFKDGKMSSRTGKIIGGDDLVNGLRDHVRKKMDASENTSVAEGDREETADKIAIASIKYSILKNGIGTDIAYDKDEVLSLSGNTGAYLLYTYARTRSVLEDAIVDDSTQNITLAKEEIVLLRHIYKFEEAVLLAAKRYSPNHIATFVFELAQKFNTFYAEVPILKAKTHEERMFRLQLTQAVGQVIKNGLRLLGIQVVDKM